MREKNRLNGIILSIVDERGPHPRIWYPDFAPLTQIHNSAVKSFSIMIGDKSYREKSPSDLTCFGILPFPDIKAIGLIHFSGVDSLPHKKPLPRELPATITLMFDESYRDEVCKNSPQIHQFLERETKALWPSLQDKKSDTKLLSKLYNKLLTFFNSL